MKAIARLLRMEFYQFVGRRFFIVSIVILAAAVPLIAWLQIRLRRDDIESDYRTIHALHVFAFGAQAGLTLATYLTVIFTSMSFAGEFDHGTIKNILIRPVRRRDVFVAKCLTAIGVLLFFQLLALYAALLFGALVGDLGPVWSRDYYIVTVPLETLAPAALRAVMVAMPAGLAAVGISVWISNLTESSGWAVASALVLMVMLNLSSGVFTTVNFFFYPEEALKTLESLAAGSSHKSLDDPKLSGFLKYPLATGVLAAALAYPAFRFKDVKV